MKVKVVGFGDKIPAGSIVINTTSGSKNWSRGLSPFFLGPCSLYGDKIAKNVENGWQYSKVYPCHIDENGEPTSQYFFWADRGWRQHRADRYPMGKGAIPKYSYWDGEKLDYITARKRIYIPLYSRAVIETGVYKQLRKMYNEFDSIYLWDFDGYDHEALGMTLSDVMNNPEKKMGHAFVLAAMLEGGW